MRPPLDKQRLLSFLEEFGNDIPGSGVIYLTGGATALIYGWRGMTVDVDLKADPEPKGYFESIAKLKNSFPINIELAAPDQFVPALPEWKARSIFIAHHGKIDFYHYDPYSQAIAKLERGHSRDLADVEAMFNNKLIGVKKLHELFMEIQPELIRYPSIDIPTFIQTIEDWCDQHG